MMTKVKVWLKLAIMTSLAVMACLGSSAQSHAAGLAVQVTDNAGLPVEDAAVYAEPLAGEPKRKSLNPVEIAQRKRQFVPLVTVIQVGTEISFPNYDSVKHHVYSFSPAKPFDQPLYSGKVAPPQLFDKVGTVVLGCNIHDKMVAYVQVVNTPYFGKTDVNGKVRLDGLNPGQYALKVWHYSLPQLEQVVSQTVTLKDGDNTAGFKIKAVKKAVESVNLNSNSY